ncbi:hypothetical protein [Bacillus seohaeanensis]|uniref:Transposase n=1 Tax=Bacillus seohaeanensis TaxID=284580 RepID=A0ABW5RLU1_9BACI
MDRLNGESLTIIFTENGFTLEIIDKDIPKKKIYNWQKVYDKDGKLGLQTDTRGQAKAYQPSQKELSVEEKLRM